jgi:hypothetical protein
MRRMKAPITVWLRMAPCAARRNIAVARFLVLLALELSTLPPLIRLSGHYFNQEQSAFSLFQQFMSKPVSPMMVRTASVVGIDPLENTFACFDLLLRLVVFFFAITYLSSGMLLCCQAQRTRPELVIFEKNLPNRMAPGRRSPIWSLANAITKLLGTKLAIWHKAPMSSRS